ncbi:hypothetical protein E1N66_18825 [Pantoea allii]|nr:hypothetical protein [Pantoea allii]THB82846.1 hypothetical protein E1N66_18825 [Pantoea allii]
MVDIFMVHPNQRPEQMEIEYSAEAKAIFVTGHASLKRGVQKILKDDLEAGLWRFQAEIARAIQKLSTSQH